MSIKASAQTQTPSEVRMSDGTFSNIARSIAAGVAALGLSQQAPSEAHGAESPTTPITMRSQSPRATTYNLMQTPLSLEMQSGSLEQVVGQLSYLSGVPIEVLWEGPRFPAGLSRDTELSFAVKNLPLGAALDRLAEKLTAFDGSVTWQVLQDGRLQFGTKETLNRFQERRIYPLEDLLAQHPQFANAPAFDLNGALQQGHGGGGGSIIGEPREERTPRAAPTEGLEAVENLIINTIEQEQWQDNGGSGGFIQALRGNLIITAAPYIHRQLE